MKIYKTSLFLLILLLCYIPIIDVFVPKTNFGQGIPDLDAVRFTSYLLIIFFSFECAIFKKVRFKNTWLIIIANFVLIKTLSPIWSIASPYSIHIAQEVFYSTILPLLIAFVALNILNYQSNIHQYLKHLIYAAVILSVLAIIQQFFGLSTFFGVTRAAATMNNPNLLAIYLVAALPGLLYFQKVKMMSRSMSFLYSVIILSGVLSTVSRKGAIGALLCFFMFFILQRQYKKLLLSFLAFAVIALSLSGYAVITERFAGAEIQRQLAGKWRMTMAGLSMFTERPIIGNGYNGYYQRFSEFFPHNSRKYYDAHNEFVTALANYGLIGFFLFGLIFVYPLIYAWPRLKPSPFDDQTTAQRDLAIVSICTIIPFMFSAFYAGYLFSQVVVVFIFYANTSILFCSAINASSPIAQPVQSTV
jgi:O-antigen ligase